MRKLLGVLTEKIAVTEPPDATGGRYYYLSPQWFSLMWGFFQILDRDEFWENPQQARDWLAKALAPKTCLDCDGENPEPLPPIVEYIYIIDESCENENEDCEGDSEMGNCGSNVRYDDCTGVLQYRNSNGAWVDIPPMQAADVKPGDIPDENIPSPGGDVACAKANALWDITAKYMDGLFDTSPPAIFGIRAVPYWIGNFRTDYTELPIREVETAVILGAPEWQQDFDADLFKWNADKATIKEVFICQIQDGINRTGVISDADVQAYRDYRFDTGSESLDGKLNSLVAGIPRGSHIEATLKVYVQSPGEFSCNCAGDAPAPPDQTEPEVGQFGVYAGEVVGDPVGGSSPATVRANATKQGTKSGNLYTSRPGELVDRPLLCVMWEFTEPTEQVSVDILWNVLGGTLSTCLGIQWFWSPNETTQFQSLGYSGAWCEGTNGWPNDAPSGWQLGTAPSSGYWSGNMGFLLARFDIGGTNTAGVTHTIQAKEPVVRGKAVTGGNYRAVFQDLPDFKAKSI